MNHTGRLFFIAAAIAATAFTASAQQSAKRESFSEFRARIHSDFQTFRKSILDDYDKFLDGAWKDYEQIKGEARDNTPKPRTAPRVEEVPQLQPAKPEAEAAKPARPRTAPEAKPVAEKPVKPAGAAEKPAPAAKPAAAATSDSFTLGESTLFVPHVDFNILNRLNTTADYAMHWRALTKSGIGEELAQAFADLADRYGLNDYLTFQAVNAYVDSRFPSAHSSARKSLVHFILANMGYDIRIATSSTGQGLLLIPFNQHVYAHPFAMIDGERYYIFSDANVDLSSPENRSFSTCKIPSDLDSGKHFDLLISDLRLPEIPQSFSISYGDMKIAGEFNRAVIPLLYRYPQMETADYARCNVLPSVRKELVKQLKEQLGGLSKPQAVNKLLTFVQNGFEYSTDEDFHGFEKPYFVEEMLFYPKNDCEDRAIFYTGMLWDALGVPNQLIAYPGHESAAVALPSKPADCPQATSYTYSGSTFYISDPTYIGSVTGMCIPQYETTVPKIDYTYE